MATPAFSSRWAMIAATLGMAIGTGNLWRFPRILARNGGGTFLIAWLVFLLIWSIPLLMVEFGLGRGARRGPVGAFARIFGPGTAWRGGFVAICTLAIMFYYSVVAGWTVRYLAMAVSGGLSDLQPGNSESFFTDFAHSWQPALYHLVAIGVACGIVARGVAGGIERACKLLVPSLFVVLLIAAVRGLTLPGSGDGLAFLFSVDWPRLADHTVWLEALSQSAWSTGAGWGLMLCYAVYADRTLRAGRECVTTGVGNNLASLLAALAIIPAVFALAPLAGVAPDEVEELVQQSGPANTGLTFIWVPVLFRQLPWGGGLLSALFFLALTFAALSSLIAMVELGVRTLVDLGHPRARATWLTFAGGLVLGLPSAVDLPFIPGHTGLGFFDNQDWVWGVGLIVSGGIMGLSVLRHGVRRFWDEQITGPEQGPPGAWHGAARFCLTWLVPLQFLGLLGWWFYQAWTWVPVAGEDGAARGLGERLADWLDPFDPFSVGTCLVQWGAVIALLVLFNRPLARRSAGEAPPA
jgi:NSS family neurotransmitter:Na+ symporter